MLAPNDTTIDDRQGTNDLALVLDRYLCELEATGIPPDVDKLAAEHPELADELRGYIGSLQTLHQMTAGLRAPGRSCVSAAAAPSRRLGDFEIFREIGRGGMGIVYEARQLSLNRQVALKVLPFAMVLDERQIARFRTEAQAAAQLHHPNIVPVFAVGQERGVHYFAMQYVEGQSLESALAELRGVTKRPSSSASAAPPAEDARRILPERDRETAVESNFSTKVSTRNRSYCRSAARLIVQAADALHHAHEFGVIHRDVKPSNLLLDRDGKLWVSDFGLARIQTDSGVTFSGDVVGTLRYMSPEQAAGDSARVDGRTDVYSLGATLYELLTLEPVHRGDNRQQVLRYIESAEPVPPRTLNPSIPFDLETITLRALAKSRDDRYGGVRELADDLRRYLAGEPTLARRPSTVDRAAKWALRHRTTVALAASFMVILTLVSSGAAIMIARAHQRTADANLALRQNLDRVEEHYQQARQVVDRFGAGVANQLSALPGAEPLRRELLNETLGYYRQFIAYAADDPTLAAEMAATNVKAAAIAESLGDRSNALDHARKALELFDRLAHEAPADEPLAIDQAKACNSLGVLLAAAGNSDDALVAYRQAIAELQPLADGHDKARHMTAARALAESYSNLGLLEGRLDRDKEARGALNDSIHLLEKLVAEAPGETGARYDLAIGHNNLSFVEREFDLPASEQSCRRAVALLEKLVAEDAAPLAYRSDLALCYNNLGAILGRREQWQEACDSYERAINLQRQLTRQASAVVSYRRDLAVSLNNLGQAQQQQLGDMSAATASFAAAREIVALLVSDYPDELTFRSLYGAVLNNQGMALEKVGGIEDALAAFELAIVNQKIAYERAPQVAEYREFLSKHYFNYGRALRTAGKPAKAAAIALERRKLWPEHGEHLGQIAVELAQAATQLREQAAVDAASEKLKKIESQVIDTLQAAAAAGCELTKLRSDPALQFLHNDSLWANLAKTQTPPEP